MGKRWITGFCLLLAGVAVSAQEIRMSEKASLEQVYGETYKEQELMSMNDMSMDFGYVLYETQFSVNTDKIELEVENVRDYAAVYVDDKFVGNMTDDKKELCVQVVPGKHKLRLYVENIGRVTYGPEILDNSKGLFGKAFLNEKVIEYWEMTPLNVKECQIDDLSFSECKGATEPSFFRGTFNLDAPCDTNLDMSGWGMGEVWINGQYAGSYWEETPQQSISVSSSMLRKGENQIAIFELKNNGTRTVRLSDKPVFK